MGAKVIIISAVYPYPIDNGKKVVLAGILDYLSKRYESENIKYLLIQGSSQVKLNEAMPHISCSVLQKPSSFEQLINVIKFSFIKRTKSIQEALLYSNKIQNYINKLIIDESPDLVLYDTVRLGQYNIEKPGKIRRILYMEDLFSVRYQKMLDAQEIYREIKINAIGNFARFLPSFTRNFLSVSIIEKSLLKLEKKLISKSECNQIKYFTANLLLNDSEASLLKEKTKERSIYTINPYICKKIAYKRNFRGLPEFVFLGSLNFPQNAVSIISFIKTQMNSIIERLPNVKLRIIGTGASEELLELTRQYSENISVEGYIEDLNSVFKNCCAMIIPLLFGSGVKLKTLEALSYGLPIITTDFGIEGIPVIDQTHCIIENDIGNYREHMFLLLDKSRNNVISQSARVFYEQHYDTAIVAKQYDSIFMTDVGNDSPYEQ